MMPSRSAVYAVLLLVLVQAAWSRPIAGPGIISLVASTTLPASRGHDVHEQQQQRALQQLSSTPANGTCCKAACWADDPDEDCVHGVRCRSDGTGTYDSCTVWVMKSSGYVDLGTLPIADLTNHTVKELWVSTQQRALYSNEPLSFHMTIPAMSTEPLAQWSALTQLENLWVERYNLHGSLPAAWSTLTGLKTITLSGNDFQGGIPPQWSTLTSLWTLSITHTNLTGTLPCSFSRLTNLQKLELTGNKLSGKLCPQWSTLTRLTRLYMENNQLTGGISSKWSTLTNLRLLHLNKNKFSGTLPASWKTFRVLKRLRLSNNKLKGRIPTSWATLGETAVSVELSYNALTGPVPPLWPAVTVLPPPSTSWLNVEAGWQTALLDNNKFTSLPEVAPTAHPFLRELYAKNNRLAGTLPSSWANLTFLSAVDLSNNKLQGTLPAEWRLMDRLRMLNLANNSLEGTVPSEWATKAWISWLQMYVNLANNSLEGTVPFGWTSDIKELHIDGNLNLTILAP